MTNNEIKNKKPALRTEIPQNLVSTFELNGYIRKATSGRNLNSCNEYITEENNFTFLAETQDCIEKYGLEAIGLYLLLRIRMANALGWGIEITGKEYCRLLNELGFDASQDSSNIDKLIEQLIASKMVYKVDENNKCYLTTLQQLYNFEYKSWTRACNAEAARNARSKRNYDIGNTNEDNQKNVENEDKEQHEDNLPYDENDDIYVDLEMPNPEDFPELFKYI